MGVYIKGMEMPTRCEDCFCYRHNAECDYAYCNISSVNVRGHGNARLVGCPLVHVPPHGRCIDADELMELYADTDDLQLENMKVPIAVIRQNIIDAPTIVKGDEEWQ